MVNFELKKIDYDDEDQATYPIPDYLEPPLNENTLQDLYSMY